jgi:hypothetical protein
MMGDSNDHFQFKDVLADELRTLNRRRGKRFVAKGSAEAEEAAFNRDNSYSLAHASDLTGLAFSGGGIRSATFNLGVLQALANVREKDKPDKKGLLSRFDYLSTVSGGGYIGSWLSAWLYRLNDGNPSGEGELNDKQHLLSTRPCGFGPDKNSKECIDSSGFSSSPMTSGFPPLEHAAVRHLRRYSNYLTPRLGLSGDTLAVVSLFLRNLVLLQLALVTLLAAIIMLPYFAAGISKSIIGTESTILSVPLDKATFVAGLLGLLTVLVISSRQLARAAEGKLDTAAKRNIPVVNAALVVLLTLASWLVVTGGVSIHGVAPWYNYLAVGAVTYSAAWWTGQFFKKRSQDQSNAESSVRNEWARAVFVPVFAGLVFGLVSWLCGKALDHPWITDPDHLLVVTTIGSPMILLVVSFIATVHIGTARDLFSELQREWWARMGGLVLLAGGIWLALFGAAYYAPPVVRWLGDGGFAVLAAWAGTSGAGAWLANRAMPDADGSKPSKIKPLLINLAPWLFLAGLAFLVAAGISMLMIRLAGTPATWLDALPINQAISNSTRELLSLPWHKTLVGLFVASALFFAITWGLDINIFSAHTMYKNRLVRAYLGASLPNRSESADPFTAFNDGDDIWLAKLDEQRPIPILNTTLNMTGGDDLAWQTRRAASFVFTPKYVGYEAKNSSGIDLGDYRRTYEYAAGRKVSAPEKDTGLKLGTAMAISGAAASPNMGYHTSAGISALLAAFNMRLGYWAGNPAQAPEGHGETSWTAWRKRGPAIAAWPILRELTGSANGESQWVNLTDGGHFENLGIYELVRRRCRLIVVTDAGCDPEHRFQDLANAVRKCWTDLGVHIYLPSIEDVAIKTNNGRYSKEHGCLGLIEYPDRKRGKFERYGILLYLKSSLTKEDVAHFVDIRQYAKEHPAFPHETTGDQFFDEEQFEAYRHLGYCVAAHFRSLIDDLFVNESSELNRKELEKLKDKLLKEQKRYESLVERTG